MTLYDVKSSKGLILNEQPLSFRDAVLFSCDADIDSEDTSTVVESTRKPKSRRPGLLPVVLVLLLAALITWRVLS